ncbi:MAG TPA: hypothetical protein VHF50_07780, partial [Solirubrobacterales bacterium]|nr:hypothetical protein [Solirubrobacterales bacterium]
MSSRYRLTIALLVCAASLALVAVAHAGKTVETTWGGLGVTGGLFENPRGVAVVESTGQVYVADTGNDRIQRLSAAGEFELAFGRGVTVAGGSGDAGGANEQQKVSIAGAAGGTFTLRFWPGSNQAPFETTPAISRTASASEVGLALEQLPSIAPGDVLVSGANGGPYTVEFTGQYAAADVDEMNPDSSGLLDSGGQPGGTVTVVTVTPGAPNFEYCTIASECRSGSAGTTTDGPGGEFNDPSHVVVQQATGDLFVLDRNARVSKFTIDDNATPGNPSDDIPVFDRAFGWDVISPGQPGNVSGNERQRLTLEGATGGTFMLHWGTMTTTAPIAFNAGGSAVESALEGLPNIASGDVTVTGPEGGPWEIEFTGAFQDRDVASINALKGGNQRITGIEPADEPPFPTLDSVTIVDGGRFEVCTSSAQCKPGILGTTMRPRSITSDFLKGESSAGGAGGGQVIGLTSPDSWIPQGVSLAVRSDGDLFVGSGRRINQYQTDGDFLRAFGWGVDTGADQFEVCTVVSGCQHAILPPGDVENGSPMPAHGQLTRGPSALVVDAAGLIYAAWIVTREASGGDLLEAGKPFVTRFDSTKSLASEILLPNPITSGESTPRCGYCTPGPLPFDPTTKGTDGGTSNGISHGLVVDPDSNHLYYQSTAGILELDTTTVPATLVDTHIPGGATIGLALHDAIERLYAARVHRLVVIGDTPATAQVATIEAPTGITDQAATLSGEVTPNGPAGIDTAYRFEYSADGSEWHRIPAKDQAVGDGTAAVRVSQAVTGLEPNTEYRARLVAVKEFGLGTVTSAEVTFTTDALPVRAETRFPQSLTPTSAILTAAIDPRNSPTSYYFEYGPTAAYGSRIPIPDGSLSGGRLRFVTAALTDLSPETTYHYRVVATNGVEVSAGDAIVEGEDVAFTTRAVAPDRELRSCATGAPAPAPRCFEMVTPPFKSVRSAIGFGMPVRNNANVGVASLDGNTVSWQVPFFPLTDDVGWPANNDRRIIRRTAQGWVNETQNTLELMPPGLPVFLRQDPIASSADFETLAIETNSGVQRSDVGGLLPTEGPVANRLYTFRKGTGVEGFNPWLTNPEKQVDEIHTPGDIKPEDAAAITDDGAAMARWGAYGGLAENYATPADEDPSDNQPANGARMLYLQAAESPEAMPTAPKDLVNECTGSGASATRIPERTGAGLIGARACSAGALTHLRGAALGSGTDVRGTSANDFAEAPAATALSEDGKRVFFATPDPAVSRTSCDPAAFAANTNCPPQIFVRQYDTNGIPTVRWISHSRSIPAADNGFTGTANPNQLIANQSVAQMGPGVAFLGASRKGDVVYFQTNAPLVPNDPNGGTSITSGSASNLSWDLYRYELPQSLDSDPDGGVLTRITGGPNGTADPNTNGGIGPIDSGNSGGAARYVSDSGDLVYFVTKSPLGGADAIPPTGGGTSPGGTPANDATRNLYVYDHRETGPAKYRFIAQLPVGAALDQCASFRKEMNFPLAQDANHIVFKRANCFRGTLDGERVAFMSMGQLSSDDGDEAADVYLYDYRADELVRVSAPPAGAEPYTCLGEIAESPPPPGRGCNADFGFPPSAGLSGSAWGGVWGSGRGWSGLRQYNISENPDGTVSVFFQSRSELVPEDTNGDYWDVYEWRNGELSLI